MWGDPPHLRIGYEGWVQVTPVAQAQTPTQGWGYSC